MSFEILQVLAKAHYDRVKEVLREYLVRILKNRPGEPVDILEVGPGKSSILIKSIEDPPSKDLNAKPSSKFDLHAQKTTIGLLFIDKENLTEVGGRRFRFSFDKVRECEIKAHNLVLKGRFINQEFNEYLGSPSGEKGGFDLIVMHGALHELYVASREEAADNYFTRLFGSLHGLLKENGTIFFGDPYYPPYYTSSDSYSVVEYLHRKAKHGNAPVAFIHPEYLLSLLVRSPGIGFTLLHDEEVYYNIEEIGLNRGRKFYIIVLQKAKDELQ